MGIFFVNMFQIIPFKQVCANDPFLCFLQARVETYSQLRCNKNRKTAGPLFCIILEKMDRYGAFIQLNMISGDKNEKMACGRI